MQQCDIGAKQLRRSKSGLFVRATRHKSAVMYKEARLFFFPAPYLRSQGEGQCRTFSVFPAPAGLHRKPPLSVRTAKAPGFPFMSGLPPQSEGAVPIHYCWERAAWAFQHRSTEKFPTLGSQNGSFTPSFASLREIFSRPTAHLVSAQSRSGGHVMTIGGESDDFRGRK